MTDEDPPTDIRLATLASAVEEVRVTVQRIDTSLRGNGRRGLFTEVALMKGRVHTLEESQREAASLRKWVTLGVLSVAGTLVWNIAQTYLGWSK